MHNEYVSDRLDGILRVLQGQGSAAGAMTAATRGAERAAFIDLFLANVFPSPYRFGSGDVTDENGARSGQLDVVVEYPYSPSLPVPGVPESRLYLAEGVAAAIEVKSDVSGQWDEVLSTAERLAILRRSFGARMVVGRDPSPRVPLFAVGYRGWTRLETLQERIADGPIDGILVLDPPGFWSGSFGIGADGSWALWMLITCLHRCMSDLKSLSIDLLRYSVDR